MNLDFIKDLRNRGPLVAVIRLEGAIASGPRGLNDRTLAPLIEKAFRSKAEAVALQINSPGGSAVQSSMIASRIRRLSDEHSKPVLAFVEDVAASGGYWLATAADQIYIDRGSVLGSIGVIAASFGFHGVMEKNGIERRVHTAGKSKSFLDPFRPEKLEDVARLTEILEELHGYFIDHVKSRRAAMLAQDPEIFTGRVWVGETSIKKGLADEVGHLVPVMKERFGENVRFRVYGQRRSLISRLGANLASDALGAIEERAAYARFGL